MVAPDQALQKGQLVVVQSTPQLIVAETVDLNQQYSRRMNIMVHRFTRCLFPEMAGTPFAPAYGISKLSYLFPQTAEQVATSLFILRLIPTDSANFNRSKFYSGFHFG